MKKVKHLATIDIADHDLFGEINSVIEYLSEIRDSYSNGETIELSQNWSGYEDNYFEILVSRFENDDEYTLRLVEEHKEFLAEMKLQDEIELEQKRVNEILQQIENLKKEL
jgi:hypothetical protein